MSEHNGTYPELTVELAPDSVTSVGRSATGGSINAIVSGALRQVLGWRSNTNDPQGFVDSLSQSFEQSEVNGSKQWTWRPHSYSVYSDGSAITGAQASIYDRAKNARDKALPLLDALMPLRTDSDDEDVDATRAIIESDLTGLVNEIGKVGGPRIARVDIYFASLLGAEFIREREEDIQNIGGNLEKLKDRLGLTTQSVNTIEEEENFTNFFMLTDYLVSLHQSWRAQKHFFDREGSDVFLGTQLVWINRALANLGESVQEARFIFDSLFINDAERETLHLTFPTNSLNGGATGTSNGTPRNRRNDPTQSSITLAELLDWVENFATIEAPRLIRDSGKDGVIALRPQVSSLLELLQATSDLAVEESDNPAPGFHTPRAQRSLQEMVVIATDLNRRVTEIERVSGPQIDAVNFDYRPDQINIASEELSFIQIKGSRFDEGTEVYLYEQLNGLRVPCLVVQVKPTQILCIKPPFLTNEVISKVKNLYVLVFNPDDGEDQYLVTPDDFSTINTKASAEKSVKKK